MLDMKFKKLSKKFKRKGLVLNCQHKISRLKTIGFKLNHKIDKLRI
jgi:hypothetical protein